MTRRTWSPIVVFLGVLALIFLVLAPIRAATRADDSSPSPRTTITDGATPAPSASPRRTTPATPRPRGSGRSARPSTEPRSMWDALDEAAERKRRSDAQLDEDSTDRTGTRWTPFSGRQTATTRRSPARTSSPRTSRTAVPRTARESEASAARARRSERTAPWTPSPRSSTRSTSSTRSWATPQPGAPDRLADSVAELFDVLGSDPGRR